MKTNYNKYLFLAIESAQACGKYLLQEFGKQHTPVYKSEKDVGLIVDKESERIVLSTIQKTFPTHNIYSEEIGEINNQSDYTWYIDPLDGTNNFYCGIGYFSASIALKEKDKLVVGVVYNPVTNQLFSASLGEGARLNGKAVTFSKNNVSLSRSTLSFIKGHRTNFDGNMNNQSIELERFLSAKFRRILTMWAPALDWSLLAFDFIDVLISFESELEDQYAGTLIAQEAGIEITNFNGNKYSLGDPKIIACRKELTQEVLEFLNKYK